ncbi:MAG: Asp-tRNA(Asn)/Glu-tRNA(Gln) amidotransferase subunit GatC [Candidatus Doudnabacteria bacterium]|nr:Asp-tRNA(Asn)/Glu-tRNA(Gln) amidotransferase subunit GatC [Candidatus Doudnabacteria bacterium]
MAISLDEVNRIAKLARLRFTDEEKIKLQQELSAILDYVGQLKKVETKTVEEKLFEDLDSVNRMRDDFAEVQAEPAELLNLAPDREGDFFKVRSVLE